MKSYVKSQSMLQTLLVVNGERERLSINSNVLTSCNQICFSIAEAANIVPWVQQHQPDLIILNLTWLEATTLQLIASLRLDWLTRSIPILMVADAASLPPLASLDYDACLHEPYSLRELEQAVCSLVSLPACKL